jgi:hypothetical protein
MKQLLSFLTLLTIFSHLTYAQDNTYCNPYLLRHHLDEAGIKFRESGEESIGIARYTTPWGVTVGGRTLEHAKLTQTVVLPAGASNINSYVFFAIANHCTLPPNAFPNYDIKKDCWATKTEQLTWGSFSRPRISYERNGTVIVSVDYDNESDCDPRKVYLIVSYR